MPSTNLIQNSQLIKLTHDLEQQKSLYHDALLRDEILAIKKEIRIKIKELEVKLSELNRNYKDILN